MSSLEPVRTEKLDSDVLVMKPADQGMRHDAANPLNPARDRRIFVKMSGAFSRCCNRSHNILGLGANAARLMR